MKVVIALASSSGQLSGVQRHAINLARCLLLRDEITQVHLVVAPWQLEFVLQLMPDAASGYDGRLRLHAAPIGNNVLSRNFWFYAQLPQLATQLEADVVHLAYPAPVSRAAFNCPTVVTLHDLYPYDIPQNFGFPKMLFNRAVLRQCLRAVDAIACVSQSTHAALMQLDAPLAQRKAAVIYNSVEAQSLSTPVEYPLPHVAGQPFLLCVAQHRRNKNILLALRVFERVLNHDPNTAQPLHMLIVGIPGPETSAIERYIARARLQHRVTLLNGISEGQLQWCYRNCRLLIAPSFFEGFGLPVAEALLAGCRVLCSDIPAFREIGGDRCHYIPLGPSAEQAFADAASAMLDDRPPAAVSLPQLSAPVVAAGYVRLYRSLLPAQTTGASDHSLPFIVEERRRPS
jgi:glycosyltransferase involved in cell wall biosynthesis